MTTIPKQADVLVRLTLWAVIVPLALAALEPVWFDLPLDALSRLMTSLVYLAMSVGIAVWVAKTLAPSWHPFLLKAMAGRVDLAIAAGGTARMLFVLIGAGFAACALPFMHESSAATYDLLMIESMQATGRPFVVPATESSAIEVLASALGKVLIVLGALSAAATRSCMRLAPRRIVEDLADFPQPPPLPTEGTAHPLGHAQSTEWPRSNW